MIPTLRPRLPSSRRRLPTAIAPRIQVGVLRSRLLPIAYDLETATLEGGASSNITIQARRTDNNSAPPVGSTLVVSTTAGTLSNLSGTSSGVSIPIAFGTGGVARATLTLPIVALTAQVQAQLENSFGQATVRIIEGAEEPPLFIESVSPNIGPPSGGTQVVIQGSGFDEPVRVTFGELPADVLSVRSGSITVRTPAITLPVGQVSTVAVSVQINVNELDEPQGADTLGNAFTYARDDQVELPSIISISPTSGPNEGGTQVTILGEGFGSPVQVFFGSGALIEATVLQSTSTRIVVRTPSATGPNAVNQNSIVGVRVTNSSTGASADFASAYQYGSPLGPFISTAGPTEGVYLGGTDVTIFGQGFEEPVAIEFGAHAQQVISVSGTEIGARSVPVEIMNCNRPTGPFSVVNIETNEVADSGISFTYIPIEPLISDLTPNSIEVDVVTRDTIPNGASVLISGLGFDNLGLPPRVIFGTDTVAFGAEVLAGSLRRSL